MEKQWEDAMGEDWREFRAKLVAQEHAGEELASVGIGGSTNNKQAGGSKKEEGVGKLIGAISSIFSKGEPSKNKEQEKAGVESTTVVKEGSANIFDGDTVGGAAKFSMIPSPCDDPFMDEEECHIIYDEPVSQLDKHRWSHPLFHIEPGCILVANEKLGGVFHQTVVLIIDHNEETGSTGMVINRYVQLLTIASLCMCIPALDWMCGWDCFNPLIACSQVH